MDNEKLFTYLNHVRDELDGLEALTETIKKKIKADPALQVSMGSNPKMTSIYNGVEDLMVTAQGAISLVLLKTANVDSASVDLQDELHFLRETQLVINQLKPQLDAFLH